MGTAAETGLATPMRGNDDEVSEELTSTGDSHATKLSSRLRALLISDFAVLVLCVASIACIFGLTRQLVLLWKITQEGQILGI